MLYTYFLLVFLAYLVPFTLLSSIYRMWGSFFFWMAFGGVALFLLLRMMGRWSDEC